MKHSRIFATLIAATLSLSPFVAQAEMLTDDKGMTLYIFDKDVDGVPTCYDDCAAKWPPFLVVEGVTMDEDWTQVERTDGTKQWAYDGKPVYFYIEDMAAGDMKGDGLGDVWHVVEAD